MRPANPDAGVAHALNGNHVGEPRISVDVAPNDIEEVDLSRSLQAAGNFKTFVFRDASVQILVRGKTDAQNELVTNPLPNRLDDFE